MTREIMEKKFYEKFCIPESYERLKDDIYSEEIKNYIFNELIPELFRGIMDDCSGFYYDNAPGEPTISASSKIKQKAKEKFNIDL